jgi:hypothetical protein
MRASSFFAKDWIPAFAGMSGVGWIDPSLPKRFSSIRRARPDSDDTIALPATPRARELPPRSRRPNLGTDAAREEQDAGDNYHDTAAGGVDLVR